jgi:hypothetical protein
MTLRGANTYRAKAITSALSGAVPEDARTGQEFPTLGWRRATRL